MSLNMDLDILEQVEDRFDPGNLVECLYRSLTGNPLRDSAIELECLKVLCEYIHYLEDELVAIHQDFPPIDHTVEDIRKDFYEQKTTV